MVEEKTVLKLFSIFRTTPPEEMEQKYLRVLASALLTCKLILSTVHDDIQPFVEGFEKIISPGNFWKFGKHTNTSVRSGCCMVR